MHRYYQEQYQLDGGAQNRYVTGSDAIGLTMGYYDTKALPIYKYLHDKGHPDYAIADNFFQARVRRLVPEPPVADRGGDAGLVGRAERRRRLTTCTRSLDANGMPNNVPALRLAARARRSRTSS